MSFEYTVTKGGKALRCGYTTGSCAALAAGAATRMLLTGRTVDTARLMTPKGVPLEVAVCDALIEPDSARCAIRKDAGDDIDATRDLLIYAEVCRTDGGDIHIEGGPGVGRVTRPGLDQPVGAAAINRVPRRMIAEAVTEARAACGYTGGLRVTISVPGGEAVALKTFNPQLGIEGGISILGTSGIVEPMSVQALIDTIETELKMNRAEGVRQIVLTPGNYGESFIDENPALARLPHVKCSNFIGEAIDLAHGLSFESVLLVGHIGKLVKVAGGIMDTHSRMADCRAEIITAHAALCGVDKATAAALMACPTTDAALDILAEAGLLQPVMAGLLARIQHHLARRAGDDMAAGAILFSNLRGCLGETEGARQILSQWEES